ncbi:unnamed protein product [Ilex paraguariensis]|uniref:Protein CYCLOPS n=1 Tax=Ilex paraguariensis TaxID=185542 RepID=A0ABC8UCE7_9AQUA
MDTIVSPLQPNEFSYGMSTELVSVLNQQQGGFLQRKRSNEALFLQNTSAADEPSRDLDQLSLGNPVEEGSQGSNLYLAKAWFNSSQAMTRSRSSELRRRYAAMQISQASLGMEAEQNTSGLGINNLRQDFENPHGLDDTSMHEIPNQFNTFMPPTNSSSSNFNIPQMGTVDKVSSVVNMLKGTLERKKLSNHIEKEVVENSSLGYYGAQEVLGINSLNREQANYIHEVQGTIQDVATVQLEDSGVQQTVGGSFDFHLEGYVVPTNPIYMSTVSQEPSQSESSVAAPVASTGFDACDGPSYSPQTLSNCETSWNQVGSGRNSENGPRAKVEKGDPTKKRRVERSRKMAEAKEKNLTPTVSSDVQSILKRCENLEKEVRSLKLNLAFMNRKDSEQTKQIEELQKQNEELTEEKERLLEEIVRIISETGKM